MKILLTNDDGYDAPGLKNLIEVAKDFGEIFICAPKRQYSLCGHQLNLNVPLKANFIEDNFIALEGAPADCVRVALDGGVLPEFDLIISGVNMGSNFGIDFFISGTVAAAREAAVYGKKAIAVSQYFNVGVDEINWQASKKLLPHALRWVLENWDQFNENQKSPFNFWNINLPKWDEFDSEGNPTQIPEIQLSRPINSHFPLIMEKITNPADQAKKNKKGTELTFIDRSDYNMRIATPNTDIHVCGIKNKISVSFIDIIPS